MVGNLPLVATCVSISAEDCYCFCLFVVFDPPLLPPQNSLQNQ